MIAKVMRDCERLGLLEKGRSVIVALSGGADSVALMHFFCSVKEQYHLTVYAAHLHHGIRGEEADRDEQFCKAFCEKNNILLFCRHRDIPMLAKMRGISENCIGSHRFRQCRDAVF